MVTEGPTDVSQNVMEQENNIKTTEARIQQSSPYHLHNNSSLTPASQVRN